MSGTAAAGLVASVLGVVAALLPASGAAALTSPGEAGASARAGVRPVAGPLVRAFDPPTDPYGSGHRGVDLRADPGEQVRAALPGRVAFSGAVAGSGWVTVDHGGGLDTTYGPLQPRLVSRGQGVAAGDVLGRLAAGAAHLDWGARLAGDYIDPLALLAPWRPRLVPVDAPPPDRPPAASPALPPAGRAGPDEPDGPAAGAARGWPVRGRVTSGFGLRSHPVTGLRRSHAGIDIAAPAGTPVRAATAGRVASAGPAGGYGLLVVVDAGKGLRTRYAHLSRIDVRPGQPVGPGTVLGAVGSTGVATGAHLHFEVRRAGTPTDPLRWLP